MDYDFEFERVKKEIVRRKAKKVLVQLPEGLKQYAKEIMDKLSETGAEIILSADPCYGACDIKVNYDLTIHYGHTQMIPSKNVVYVPCYSKKDVMPVVKKAEQLLPKSVGIVTTAQHLHKVAEVMNYLKKKSFSVHVHRNAQILGCDVSNALAIKDKVDGFLFIGSGLFHPQMLSFATKKKVIRADPYTGEVEKVEENWEKERYIRISKAVKASTFAIVIGEKPGQKHLRQAMELKKKIPNSYLISAENIKPELLDYLPFDAFVITACPRIVLDDWKNYKKALLLPDEALELMKIIDSY
ncbi:diphthamide biosynthesis enzyme Dph2 [Candidatus Micrarchaeota archaeon]|nr:MAG: diphthamide biosynthesis enzyme Dph2 [Candidatus Micrarchaeota archaeon]